MKAILTINKIQLTSLLLFIVLNVINSSNLKISNEYETCKYTLSDGNKVDFTHLRRQSGDYSFTVARYEYRANFCGQLNNGCIGSTTPAAVFLSGTICLNKLSTGWQQSSLEYIDSNIQSKGVKIKFQGGDRCYMGSAQHLVTYLMLCDMNKELEFQTVIKHQACSVEYHFATKWACPVNFIGSNSLLNSKKILIYLIIIFSLYCIGFSVINYRSNPEDGVLKALPHREFWGDFVDNAKLGAKIIVKNIKDKVRGKQDDYNNF